MITLANGVGGRVVRLRAVDAGGEGIGGNEVGHEIGDADVLLLRGCLDDDLRGMLQRIGVLEVRRMG